MFKDEQFFECQKDCAVFVGLDRLSESRTPVVTKPPSSATAGSNKNSKNLQKQKSVEQQQKQKSVKQQEKQIYFNIGDRVMAFDNDGRTVHGTVKWTGGSTGSGKLVGIETVSHLYFIIICTRTIKFEKYKGSRNQFYA